MRTLIHLSDLHFGRTDAALLEPLIATLKQLNPDLVAVSGDLTQRARSSEFQQAQAFLRALPAPQIIVPGNHDVPLFNLFRRFAQPLNRYRQFITNDLQPIYIDDEMVVLGLNTARSLAVQGGRLNTAQLAQVQTQLKPLPDHLLKIIVTHHPFDAPRDHPNRVVVGRAVQAMNILTACGADIFLSGHLHISRTGHAAHRYQHSGHSALIVQAGTAVSTRSRGELNSFNVLSLERPYVTVTRFEWQAAAGLFGQCMPERFERQSAGWERLTP